MAETTLLQVEASTIHPAIKTTTLKYQGRVFIFHETLTPMEAMKRAAAIISEEDKRNVRRPSNHKPSPAERYDDYLAFCVREGIEEMDFAEFNNNSVL